MSEPEAEGTRENLAARIVELERELAELRARQSGMQVLTGPVWISEWCLDFGGRSWSRRYVHPEGNHVSGKKVANLHEGPDGWWVSYMNAGSPKKVDAVSYTLERARELAGERLMEWWASPVSNRHRPKEARHGES